MTGKIKSRFPYFPCLACTIVKVSWSIQHPHNNKAKCMHIFYLSELILLKPGKIENATFPLHIHMRSVNVLLYYVINQYTVFKCNNCQHFCENVVAICHSYTHSLFLGTYAMWNPILFTIHATERTVPPLQVNDVQKRRSLWTVSFNREQKITAFPSSRPMHFHVCVSVCAAESVLKIDLIRNRLNLLIATMGKQNQKIITHYKQSGFLFMSHWQYFW